MQIFLTMISSLTYSSQTESSARRLHTLEYRSTNWRLINQPLNRHISIRTIDITIHQHTEVIQQVCDELLPTHILSYRNLIFLPDDILQDISYKRPYGGDYALKDRMWTHFNNHLANIKLNPKEDR